MKTKPMLSLLGGLVLTLFFTGCDLFQYHPYEGDTEFEDVTAQNLTRLKELEASYSSTDTLKIAFISDTQGYFAETEDMVTDINNRDVDFVIHGGDLTNYAFTDEFERMHEALSKLRVPYMTVIGNHDCLGDGKKLYQKIYGPLNYSFTFGPNKFILLNTNYLEFDASVPDISWLEKELKAGTSFQNQFVVAHVAPSDPEMNRDQEPNYARLMRQYQVKLSMHGHAHNYRYEQIYKDGIPYLVVDAAIKRKYILYKIIGDQITFDRISF